MSERCNVNYWNKYVHKSSALSRNEKRCFYFYGERNNWKGNLKPIIKNLDLIQSRIGEMIDVIKTTVEDEHCFWVKNGLAGPGAWLPGGLAPKYAAWISGPGHCIEPRLGDVIVMEPISVSSDNQPPVCPSENTREARCS